MRGHGEPSTPPPTPPPPSSPRPTTPPAPAPAIRLSRARAWTAVFPDNLSRDARFLVDLLRAKRRQARYLHSDRQELICQAWLEGTCAKTDVFAGIWCENGAHLPLAVLEHDELTTYEAHAAGLEYIPPAPAPTRITWEPDEIWISWELDGRRWFARQSDDAWAWEDEFTWETYEDPHDKRQWRYNSRMGRGIR